MKDRRLAHHVLQIRANALGITVEELSASTHQSLLVFACSRLCCRYETAAVHWDFFCLRDAKRSVSALLRPRVEFLSFHINTLANTHTRFD
jgi:hypothetical protein